ncbi:MAG: AAA family ATPase [Armatimonadetes bacterium]|nr:AAA family ATPase [Armatimonadota bacterium]
MRHLVDFFNHGILPFTGRSQELERVLAFWQAASEGYGLRAMMVLGQAGSGKSRLLEEAIPAVAARGGVVIHWKLYPGTSTSLLSIAARALRHLPAVRALLKSDPEEKVESVMDALRRIARLRPLLVVIEDAHLLAGDSINDLSTMLYGLADDAIPLLCLARPQQLPVRPAIERFLVDEFLLDGFTAATLAGLWEALFQSPPDHRFLQLLLQATHGNPLAVRSAIRGALSSGALARTAAADRWASTIPTPQLLATLHQSVGLLSEGMTAHLSQQERHAAERLALLGEVFSREAACHLIGDERMLSFLSFKGIITQVATMPGPINGSFSSTTPLTFTHTLLHTHLASPPSGSDLQAIATIVQLGVPLYSVHPFHCIAKHASQLRLGGAQAAATVIRMLADAEALNTTSDWELGATLIAAARETHTSVGAGEWSAEEKREFQIRELDTQLLLLRNNYSPEFLQAAAQLMQLTSGTLPDHLMGFRIQALGHHLRSHPAPATSISTLEGIDRIVAARPELRLTLPYVRFLGIAATILNQDGVTVQGIEDRLTPVLAAPQLPDEVRRHAMRDVVPRFIWSFHSPQQLAQRITQLEEVERYGGGDDITIRTRKIALFVGLGRAQEAIALVDALMPQLHDRGLRGHILQCRLQQLYALGGLGMDLTAIATEIEQMEVEMPQQARPRFRASVGLRLSYTGMLRGEIEWARHIRQRYGGVQQIAYSAHEQILIAITTEELKDTLRAMLEEAEGAQQLPDLPPAVASYILNHDQSLRAEAIAALRELFAAQIYMLTGLRHLHAYLKLVDHLSTVDPDMVIAIQKDIQAALQQAMEWLHERQLNGYMDGLLNLHPNQFAPNQLRQWQQATDQIAAERNSAITAPQTSPEQLHVRMLGNISLQKPGEKPTPVRGARLRTLLGLLVMDQMLQQPLTYREFCRIAADGEDDPERSRKMMSMGLLRLREGIGDDAVITNGSTPQLNRSIVQVDLLEANALIQEANAALRSDTLSRASLLLGRALDISRGEVPFPGLYQNFFEAARDEFELRLRSALLAVSNRLLQEGDPATAERLLQRGHQMLADDDEISELLCAALEAQGKKVEAERVRVGLADP